MLPSSSENAATGLAGAAITVTKPGSALWHVQLSSAPTKLSAGKFYTLRYTAKSSVASSMQVALVSDSTWKVSSDKGFCRLPTLAHVFMNLCWYHVSSTLGLTSHLVKAQPADFAPGCLPDTTFVLLLLLLFTPAGVLCRAAQNHPRLCQPHCR
jgi:hypothetical protein